MPLLECVVFGLDGVVTDSAECHLQAWSRLFRKVTGMQPTTFIERARAGHA